MAYNTVVGEDTYIIKAQKDIPQTYEEAVNSTDAGKLQTVHFRGAEGHGTSCAF